MKVEAISVFPESTKHRAVSELFWSGMFEVFVGRQGKAPSEAALLADECVAKWRERWDSDSMLRKLQQAARDAKA